MPILLSEATTKPSSVWTRVIVGVSLLVLLVLSSRYSYLLYHSLIELLTIGIAFVVGVVTWYTYPLARNGFLIFLGLVFPGVATIDLVHTLVYKGMNVVPVQGGNMPTQLWVAARYFEAIAMLAAPAFLARPVPVRPVAAGVALLTTLLLWLIATGNFPTAYVDGTGLTPFKIFSEYVIVAILLAALAHLWWRRQSLDPPMVRLLVAAMGCTVMAELAFTFYVGVYDLSNLVGHIFKLFGFGLVFLGIVKTGLEQPLRFMTNEISTYDAIAQPVIVVDKTGRVRQTNRAARAFAPRVAIGDDAHRLFHPPSVNREECPLCAQGPGHVGMAEFEMYYPAEERWRSVSVAALHGSGSQGATVQVMHDITARKLAELQLLAVNRALVTISASNHALVHALGEPELLRSTCETIVQKGGYRMAWVGFVEHDEAQTIRPVVWGGAEQGYLGEVRFSWGDNPNGQAPSGRAVRSGRPAVANDVQADPGLAPWHAAAARCGFAASMAFPLNAPGRPVFGVLVLYSAVRNAFTDDEVRLLTELADDLGYGIENFRTNQARDAAERVAREYQSRLARSLHQTVEALATTIEKRDPYTAGHQHRAAELAMAIGRRMGLPADRIEALQMGGLIHDIGKIYVPAEILSRPGKLTANEFQVIRMHPAIGCEIINGVEFPWSIAEIIAQHHERLDGSGYPKGLTGESITLGARIVAVADVVEAMASHRPHRPALGIDAALEEVSRGAGAQFDAHVVSVCMKVFREDGFKFS